MHLICTYIHARGTYVYTCLCEPLMCICALVDICKLILKMLPRQDCVRLAGLSRLIRACSQYTR